MTWKTYSGSMRRGLGPLRAPRPHPHPGASPCPHQHRQDQGLHLPPETHSSGFRQDSGPGKRLGGDWKGRQKTTIAGKVFLFFVSLGFFELPKFLYKVAGSGWGGRLCEVL